MLSWGSHTAACSALGLGWAQCPGISAVVALVPCAAKAICFVLLWPLGSHPLRDLVQVMDLCITNRYKLTARFRGLRN